MTEAGTALTPGEYLAFERQAETKNEYIHGVVHPISGASRWQSRLQANLLGLLYDAVDDTPGEVLGSLMRIKAPPDTYLYPDVVVVADEARLEGERDDTLVLPALGVRLPLADIYRRVLPLEQTEHGPDRA